MFIFEDEMELETIIENALHAIRWPSKERHALDEMAVQFQDVEFLTSFFTKHRNRLIYFNESVTDAVVKTRKESNEILQKILELGENAVSFKAPDLDVLFEPLHREEGYKHPGFFTDYKAKGHPDEAPWVRIYAVRCDENIYVITGYGIKLVKQMKDDPLLVEELKKLERATDFLKTLGVL